tara:strand:- start:1940 stop:3490 length:1551 start_codon:yes stop_codon:yes gene_type:complete
MSVHKSYFKKNNTLLSYDRTNTAKNPVTEVYYGGGSSRRDCKFTGIPTDICVNPEGVALTGYTSIRINNDYSRFIFDLDITDLESKISDKTIITGSHGCNNASAKHTLRMVNTSFFDDELLNTVTSKNKRRASSFDLVLFKIPTGTTWSEGVGYDYTNMSSDFVGLDDNSFSTVPSNWYSATTTSSWPCLGIYNYTTCVPEIIATQTFDNGNENIAFDLTSEMNEVLSGSKNMSGYGVAFVEQLERLTGLTESYSVGFFTKYTQTFFEPYLETNYDDYILDDRDFFYEGKSNCLYLYVNKGGVPTNLDNFPTAQIYDNSGTVLYTITASQVTKGVYCACFTIACDEYVAPCMFKDRWSNLSINGNCQSDVTNKVTLKSNSDYFNIGTNAGLPKHYGYSISGIKMDEKIVNGDIRKVIVSARQQYTTNFPVALDLIQYRIYVKQGTTQVETQEWTKVNIAHNQNYFVVDTGDMVPNEYFIDIQAISNLEKNTYFETVKFQVVNQANYFGNPPSDYRQ